MKTNVRDQIAWLLTGICFICTPLKAMVIPAALFTDNAILQRGISVPVWGTAKNGESVKVLIAGQTATTKAIDGKWMVRLKPMIAGGPFTLSISGENAIVFTNIMVGEVWLCSGQSNMEWPLEETENGSNYIAQSKDYNLRFFTVPLTISNFPAANLSTGTWEVSGPYTSRTFSAVGYHFGACLHRALGVPIGLINASYGGSVIQAWTEAKYIRSDPESRQYLGNQPDWAKDPQNEFSVLYNGMIAPLIPFGIRGVIWYQGEGNTESGEADHYKKSFPLLISNWRNNWGEGDIPFLFVQLAPWIRDQVFHVAVDPDGTGWAVLREAQLKTSQTVKNTGMAVITDLGDENRIHPRKKEAVGQRLALAAQAIAYGQDVVFKGPSFNWMRINNGRVILHFENDGGEIVSHGNKIVGFTIAGVDRKFYPAEAKIVGNNEIELFSGQVVRPSAVRYGWSNYPIVNVFNQAGLPMSPFRTDDWPPQKPFKTIKLTSEDK